MACNSNDSVVQNELIANLYTNKNEDETIENIEVVILYRDCNR